MRTSYGPISRTQTKTAAYSPWQLNLFNGCSHGCKYCYVMGLVLKKREAFMNNYNTLMKHSDLDLIDNGLLSMSKDGLSKEPVLLSFIGDPYDARRVAEGQNGIMREVLQLFQKHGQRFIVLTKNPEGALVDLDLYGPDDALASTLTWWKDDMEPFAPPVSDRVKALLEAQEKGIRVWASLEPIGDETLTLAALREMEGLPTIPKFIGPEQRKVLSVEFMDEIMKLPNTFVKGKVRPDQA